MEADCCGIFFTLTSNDGDEIRENVWVKSAD